MRKKICAPAMVARLTAALLIVLAPGSVYAQDCTPGPRCMAASKKAESYIASIQSRLSGRFVAAGAAAANFCAMSAAAEINRLCGNELRTMGKPACANLADAQSAEFSRAAEQSKDASLAMSQGGWQRDCGW